VTGPCSSCHNGVTATGKHPAHLPTTSECNSCHTTTTWRGASFDHSTVTGLCLSCHNGSTATGKSTTHFVTTLDCERCHNTNNWLPLVYFRHDSPSYPGDHRTTVLCVDCHTTNNQVVTWPFAAYQPDCAGCHADDYTPGPHDGATVSELRDCSGSCHIGGVPRSNEHRPSAGEW
jgi:predicted CXXCH cytochrome family protein